MKESSADPENLNLILGWLWEFCLRNGMNSTISKLSDLFPVQRLHIHFPQKQGWTFCAALRGLLSAKPNDISEIMSNLEFLRSLKTTVSNFNKKYQSALSLDGQELCMLETKLEALELTVYLHQKLPGEIEKHIDRRLYPKKNGRREKSNAHSSISNLRTKTLAVNKFGTGVRPFKQYLTTTFTQCKSTLKKIEETLRTSFEVQEPTLKKLIYDANWKDISLQNDVYTKVLISAIQAKPDDSFLQEESLNMLVESLYSRYQLSRDQSLALPKMITIQQNGKETMVTIKH